MQIHFIILLFKNIKVHVVMFMQLKKYRSIIQLLRLQAYNPEQHIAQKQFLYQMRKNALILFGVMIAARILCTILTSIGIYDHIDFE